MRGSVAEVTDGEGVDSGQDGGGALGGQQRPQFAHAVLARADADAPFGHRVGAVFVDPGRVQGVHRAAHGAFELGQRLPTRPGQYPCLRPPPPVSASSP